MGIMRITSAILRAATSVLALLVSSQFTRSAAQTIQQSQTMTATASAPAKSDVCRRSNGIDAASSVLPAFDRRQLEPDGSTILVRAADLV
jgi:hypothetical protein